MLNHSVIDIFNAHIERVDDINVRFTSIEKRIVAQLNEKDRYQKELIDARRVFITGVNARIGTAVLLTVAIAPVVYCRWEGTISALVLLILAGVVLALIRDVNARIGGLFAFAPREESHHTGVH